MSWLGFDLDLDGEVSFFEHMLSVDETEDARCHDDSDDASDDELELCEGEHAEIPEEFCETEESSLADRIFEPENAKFDLESELLDLEANEPDLCSPEYDSWSYCRYELQDEIDQLDNALLDLKAFC